MNLDSLFHSSPLHEAVAMQDFDTVNRLLDSGADIDGQADIEGTPLLAACSMSAKAMMDFQKDLKRFTTERLGPDQPRRKDAPVELSTFAANMPKLDFAEVMGSVFNRPVRDDVPEDDPAMAKLLLDRGADPNLMGRLGATPLTAAASAGRVETVRLLLDRGAEIDAADGEGKTALMSAAEEGRLEAVVLLIERGADWRRKTDGLGRVPPDGGDDDVRRSRPRPAGAGLTALHFAARGGRVEIARLLLKLGLDVNSASERGAAPLLMAATFKREAMVEYLRSQGARTGFLEAVALGEHGNARRLPSPEPGERSPQWGYGVLNWAIRSGDREAVRLLADRGVRPDPDQPEGKKLLQLATFRGDAELLAILAPKSSSLEGLNSLPLNPLGTAATRNNVDVARQLLARGVDANASHEAGMCPLSQAVLMGNGNMVALLLDSGANPEGNGSGISPLCTAVMKDDLEMARLLMERGANPEQKQNGVPMAKSMAFNKPAIEALLEEYAAKRRQERGGESDAPADERLIEAVKAGELERVRQLLEAGCDVNRPDMIEMTPLLWATAKRHVEVVRLLLDSGANIAAPNRRGLSAIRYAASAKSDALVSMLVEAGAKIGMHEAVLLNDHTKLRQLLDSGTDVNEQAPDGATPLMLAASAGNLEVMRLLLARGAGQEHYDNRFGQSALAHAAASNKLEAMRLLLQHGAEPNAAGPSLVESESLDQLRQKLGAKALPLSRYASQEGEIPGNAPLHFAALMGHVDAARLLLERGAKIEQIAGSFRVTPLIMAAQGGRLEMAKLLVERGADVHAMNIEGETALYQAHSFNKDPELTAYLAEVSAAKDREAGTPITD